MKTLFDNSSSAVFSPCRTWRYRLERKWSEAGGSLCFLMLNPSTADESVNDPTIERCERRARAMGYGSLVVVNLFAVRSTDPWMLGAFPDAIGPENNEHIRKAVWDAEMTICGWGEHGGFLNRARMVLKQLHGMQLHALAINKSGHPKHPLYVGYKIQPQEWGWVIE